MKVRENEIRKAVCDYYPGHVIEYMLVQLYDNGAYHCNLFCNTPEIIAEVVLEDMFNIRIISLSKTS